MVGIPRGPQVGGMGSALSWGTVYLLTILAGHAVGFTYDLHLCCLRTGLRRSRTHTSAQSEITLHYRGHSVTRLLIFATTLDARIVSMYGLEQYHSQWSPSSVSLLMNHIDIECLNV